MVNAKRNTALCFKRGGFYTEGDRTTNIFDGAYQLRNLIECIFHKRYQFHLVDLAVSLLEYAKANNGFRTTDFWKHGDQTPKNIGEATFTFSNFQTILLHLKQAGLIEGRKGGVHRLSRRFCHFLEHAGDCWRRFLRSEIGKREVFRL